MASARDSLERAVRAVAEQATAADALVREVMAADFDGPDLAGSHAVTLRAKGAATRAPERQG